LLIANESPESNMLQTPQKQTKSLPLTRTDRIRIKTAIDFGYTTKEIHEKYGYTIAQIQRARVL
jgi:hypothetical protein